MKSNYKRGNHNYITGYVNTKLKLRDILFIKVSCNHNRNYVTIITIFSDYVKSKFIGDTYYFKYLNDILVGVC